MQTNNIHSTTQSTPGYRWFPIRLYTYVFGAGIFGWGVGTGMQAPGTDSLLALFVGAVLVVLGYRFMRPFIAAAKDEIKALDAARAERNGGANDVNG
jgi:hypothetical protein